MGIVEHPSITCPQCGMTSYNPNDIEQQYCGNCHEFHDVMGKLLGRYVRKPTCVEAMLFTGKNASDFVEWLGNDNVKVNPLGTMIRRDGSRNDSITLSVYNAHEERWLPVSPNEWVARAEEHRGDVYPIATDRFTQTWDRVL